MCATFAGLAITILRLLIFLTGNDTFFNPLTIALCLFVLDDAALDGSFARAWLFLQLNAGDPSVPR
jgi:hypothetical protein